MNVKETLASYKIPKRSVSDLCDIHSSELSAYLRRRENVSAAKALRIEQAVADIKFVLDTYDQARAEINGPSLSLNLRDTDALKKLIDFCKSNSETLTLPATALTEESAANLFSFLGKP